MCLYDYYPSKPEYNPISVHSTYSSNKCNTSYKILLEYSLYSNSIKKKNNLDFSPHFSLSIH